MAWLIRHEHDKCIGCGACAAIDPEHWVMEGDKAHLIDSREEQDPEAGKLELREVGELGGNQDAADSCPVPCIFVKKKEA